MVWRAKYPLIFRYIKPTWMKSFSFLIFLMIIRNLIVFYFLVPYVMMIPKRPLKVFYLKKGYWCFKWDVKKCDRGKKERRTSLDLVLGFLIWFQYFAPNFPPQLRLRYPYVIFKRYVASTTYPQPALSVHTISPYMARFCSSFKIKI